MESANFTLATACCLALLGVACDGAEESEEGAADGPLYAVQHNINAPEGRLVYVNLISSLDDPGEEISVDNAIELSGYGAVQAFDGALFVAENESNTISRWDVSDPRKPREVDQLSLANEEVGTFWNENFLYIDSETAWYANEVAEEIIVWNPTTMELEDRIPVTGLDMSELPADFNGLTRVGNFVFMPVAFTDWDEYQAFPEVVVVVFDVESQSVRSVLRDDRCGIPASSIPPGNVGPDGTYYVLGDGFYGTWLHGGEPYAGPSCVLRIQPGADEIDPEWSVVLDGAIEGYADMATLVVDGESGRVFTDLMRQPEEPFAAIDDLWSWQVEPGNTRRISCSLSDWDECEFADEDFDGTLHWFSTKVDDRVLMTSLLEANDDTDEYGGCVVYDMSEERPRALFQTSGFISNIVRVR